ncbi:MAG: dUTP diphosphatase [Candidatus Hydrogenedentota bacterium]|jgi:dUTP pyrophosphatase
MADNSVPIRIVVEPHAQELPLPEYETINSAGMDLRAAIYEPVIVEPGHRTLIPTGIRIALPSGTEAQVRPRSGLAIRQGISMVNSPGTIDADYRGEIQVILINHGQETVTIERGERIAQLVIAPVLHAEWDRVDSLDDTKRGDGGFGHTGR